MKWEYENYCDVVKGSMSVQCPLEENVLDLIRKIAALGSVIWYSYGKKGEKVTWEFLPTIQKACKNINNIKINFKSTLVHGMPSNPLQHG